MSDRNPIHCPLAIAAAAYVEWTEGGGVADSNPYDAFAGASRRNDCDAVRLRVEVEVLRERVTAICLWAQVVAESVGEAAWIVEVEDMIARLQPESVAAEVAARIARGETA